jgi:ribosomal-protein-alanine N-acetyltransferase
MTAVTIATLADAQALAAIHAQCFAEAWDADAIRRLMAAPGAAALMAGTDAFVLVRAAAGEAEILTLATAPEKRRRGLARALVHAAADFVGRDATQLFLEVAADNAAAIALYSGFGFVAVGRRSGYYIRPSGTADALTLRVALPLCAAGPAGENKLASGGAPG